MIRRGNWAFLAGLTLIASAASGSPQSSTPAYGVGSESSYLLTAWDMQPANDGPWGRDSTNSLYRYAAGGAVGFIGAIHVPQGALLDSIEMEGCDSSATGSLGAALYVSSPAIILGALVGTGEAAVPGCGRFSAPVAPGPLTVDNVVNQYIVIVVTSAGDATTSIGAVRVFYRLQVSPAPGTATFNDVPTSDTAFQFIEALVGSGITAGCGSGNYCPDAPLTRRQMAVFLSKALGLHWPEAPAP